MSRKRTEKQRQSPARLSCRFLRRCGGCHSSVLYFCDNEETGVLGHVLVNCEHGSHSSDKETCQRLSLMSPALAGGFFTTSATWEAQANHGSLVKSIPCFFKLYFVKTQTCSSFPCYPHLLSRYKG